MLAPFAPYICEELWSEMNGKGFISVAEWPRVDETKIDAMAEERENLLTRSDRRYYERVESNKNHSFQNMLLHSYSLEMEIVPKTYSTRQLRARSKSMRS